MSGANGDNLNCLVGQCEDCAGTGWYGDNGPGIPGNTEFAKCDCLTATKCAVGWHPYRLIDGVPWCDKCGREADLDVCKLAHPVPNTAVSGGGTPYTPRTCLQIGGQDGND